MIRDKPMGGFLVTRAVLAIVGVFCVGIVVHGSWSRPVVYDSHKRVVAPANIPAFPGAEGWGATALNACRALDSLVVHHVTTIGNQTVPGSLSYITANDISSDAYDIVVWDIGGQAGNAVSSPAYGKDCVYVAGQTARGTWGWAQSGGTPLWKMQNQSDWVIRYIAMRGNVGQQQQDTYQGEHGVERFIFDHVSIAFGTDACADHTVPQGQENNTNADNREITWQWNIIGPCLRPHSTGTLLGSDAKNTDGVATMDSVTLHHNLYIHSAHRNPLFSTDTVTSLNGNLRLELINNTIYNWKNWGWGTASTATVDASRNYWHSGPWSGTKWNRPFQLAFGVPVPVEEPFIWENRNILDSVGVIKVDSLDDMRPFFAGNPTGSIDVGQFLASRVNAPLYPVTEQSAVVARQAIQDSAGAFRTLNCDGSWAAMSRDALDVDLINDETNNLGPATDGDNTNVADYPTVATYNSGSACADTDGDDLWDDFEVRYWGSIAVTNDPKGDPDDDGYYNIEEQINASDPRGAPPPVGPTVTFGNGRWVYQDTFVEYLLITAGGADTQTVLMADTSIYSPTGLSAFGVVPKDIAAAAEGDTVLILINDSIVGNVVKQLDSGQVDSLAGILGSEGEWARCESRGICVDSLRNRSVP